MLGPYLEGRGLSAGLIGTVTMAYGATALTARIVSGAVYRRERAPWMVAGGCLAMAAAFAALTAVTNPVAIAVLIGIDGGGFGVATTAGLAAVLERYPRNANAGSVMGWYTGATGFGYAIAGFLAGGVADALGILPAILMIALLPAMAGLLLLGVLRRSVPTPADAPQDPAPGLVPHAGRLHGSHVRSMVATFRAVPPTVWIAFSVAFYVALVNGGLLTFFPIHGLDIGLSLTAIGALLGIHGAAATMVRFAAGPVFRIVDYRRSLPWMVGLNAVAVIALSTTVAWAALAVAWAMIGLSRGVLRVASGALVMDNAGTSDRARGAASTVYLAGLDVGKILGPPIAGATVEVIGLRPMFAVIGLAFAAVYFTAAVFARRIDDPHQVPTPS